MTSRASGKQGSTENRKGKTTAGSPTVKMTLHLTVDTAQRLGVESAMRRISQSAIAEEVLANYLSRWQLPAVPEAQQFETGETGGHPSDGGKSIVGERCGENEAA